MYGTHLVFVGRHATLPCLPSIDLSALALEEIRIGLVGFCHIGQSRGHLRSLCYLRPDANLHEYSPVETILTTNEITSELNELFLCSRDGSSAAFLNYYYVKPWTRAPPYLVGIWVGWYLHITKNSSIRMSKVLNLDNYI